MHLDESINPCDFNKAVSAAWLDTMLRSVALAKLAGAPLLNMHMNPGIRFTLPDGPLYLYDKFRDHYLSGLARFRDACAKACEGAETLICIENTDGFAEYACEGVELLLESELFALTLDIGHAHAAGYPDAAFYEKHRERIAHMHIHDAKERVNHLPLGMGETDLRAALRLAAERGCRRVIEVKAKKELAESAGYIRKIGEESHGRA